MANLLPLPIKIKTETLIREPHLDKQFRPTVNLKTEPLQKLLSKRQCIKNLWYTHEYTKDAYLKYQQGEPLEKVSRISKSSPKFLKSFFVFLTRNDEINDKGLIPLSLSIRRSNRLRKIDLVFDSIQMSEIELEDLGNSLKQQSSLESLSLEFRESDDVSYEGGIYFGNFLKSLQSLQRLSLTFERCSIISGTGWRHLRQGLGRLTTLKSLYLDFYSGAVSDYEALEEIGHALAKLTALESLFLCFYNNAAVYNQGIVCLGEGLANLVSLKHLNMNLAFCNKIKEYGFFSLSMNIQNLLNLEDLVLDISNCDNFTENALLHLSNTIMSLSNLRTLTLYMSLRTGIKNFRKTLQQHPSLKRVLIY